MSISFIWAADKSIISYLRTVIITYDCVFLGCPMSLFALAQSCQLTALLRSLKSCLLVTMTYETFLEIVYSTDMYCSDTVIKVSSGHVELHLPVLKLRAWLFSRSKSMGQKIIDTLYVFFLFSHKLLGVCHLTCDKVSNL